jgi:phosphatidylglycerophosphatase A
MKMREAKPETLLQRLSLEVSTLGPLGSVPGAPGTWASLLATLLTPWCMLSLSVVVRGILLILFFVVGSLAVDQAETALRTKDPSVVVLDEVFGQFAVFMPFVALSWWQLGLGFVLFRIFDILKPWPIQQMETLMDGGFAIMADDLLAAIYAAIALGLILWLLPV